jgi:hypothetical protein
VNVTVPPSAILIALSPSVNSTNGVFKLVDAVTVSKLIDVGNTVVIVCPIYPISTPTH